jgi:hypothetical protein
MRLVLHESGQLHQFALSFTVAETTGVIRYQSEHFMNNKAFHIFKVIFSFKTVTDVIESLFRNLIPRFLLS